MSAATEYMAPPTSETDRELHHRLRADVARCERELTESREKRKQAQFAALELRRSGVLVSPEDAPTRTLRKPGRPKGRRLIEEERAVAEAEADARSLEAARQMLAAVEALRRAKAALAAYELPGLAEKHAAAAEAARAATERTQRAYVELVAAAIEQGEAFRIEEMAAREIIRLAQSPLTDGNERDALRRRSELELPAALDGEGAVTEWVARPEAGLFGLGGVSWRVENDSFAQQLVDLIRAGRERLRGASGSEKVADRIIKALDHERG